MQRVMGMTENQLDGLYAQLYKKYELKVEEERVHQPEIMQKNQPPSCGSEADGSEPRSHHTS